MSEARITGRLSRRALVISAVACATGGVARAQTGDATALMRAAHETGRFLSARFEADLSLRGAGGDARRRTMQGVSRVTGSGAATARLIRFTAPADIRGAATLTVERLGGEDDLWLYLPALRAIRRLVSSNKRDAWVGSEFSYGDVVGYKVDDWRHSLVGEDTAAGAPCVKVESLPARPQIAADTGYSRRVSWIRRSDSAVARMEAYALSGGLLKTIDFNDLRAFPSAPEKRQPMEIVARASSGAVSTMRFTQFTANAPVTSAEIAPEALEG